MFNPIRATTSMPEQPVTPVLPPDDGHAPDIGREPSIDPPHTAPDQTAPSVDPRLPPTPGWTS